MSAPTDDSDQLSHDGAGSYQLRVRNLMAGKRVLVSDFEADLPATGVVLLLGQNGAGKSLLLRAISQLDQGQTVELTDRGDPVPVAAVLDFPGLLSSDRLSDVTSKSAWFGCDAETLEIYLSRLAVDVPDRSTVSKWSLGNRQRVRIATALASPRMVVLMDEPFRSIDEDHLQSLISLMVEEAERRLIIVSTHRPELLAGLATDALVLSEAGERRQAQLVRPSGRLRVRSVQRTDDLAIDMQTATVSQSQLHDVLQDLSATDSELLSLLAQPDYRIEDS